MNGTLILKDGTRVQGRMVSRAKVDNLWNCRMVFGAEDGGTNWILVTQLRISDHTEPCEVTASRLGNSLHIIKLEATQNGEPPWR